MNRDAAALMGVINASLATFNGAVRASGRTTAMIDAAKDGDVIFVIDRKHGMNIEHLSRARGKIVRAHVYYDGMPHPKIEPGQRAYFDHHTVEQYFAREISAIEKRLNSIEEHYNQAQTAAEGTSSFLWRERP